MPSRVSRTIFLDPEQVTFVSSCVASGRFQSESEVVRAGLRMLQNQEGLRQVEFERVRALVQEGADQLDRGETVEGETFLQSWEESHERLGQQSTT